MYGSDPYLTEKNSRSGNKSRVRGSALLLLYAVCTSHWFFVCGGGGVVIARLPEKKPTGYNWGILNYRYH
jgi:hypothetical protein